MKRIVGIGASAGGLEALEDLFANMPEKSGYAFVIVQHLSPDFKSHMDELIRRVTNIPVHVATENMEVHKDNIYLIPAKKVMVISNNKLHLTDRPREDVLTHPIDQFFRALANDMGKDAVAIVLSGTGSDGSRGVQAIAAAHGLVISQDDTSARFDGMPLNAQATGCVHAVMAPGEMPEALTLYRQKSLTPRQLKAEISSDDTAVLATIFDAVKSKRGVDFSNYKPSTVGRRIERRMGLLHIDDIGEYARRVEADPQEAEDLYKDLLIGVTRFFRDSDAFKIVEDTILPDLIDRALSTNTIRIWVAGCASGEEVYSIAMMLHEQLPSSSEIEVKIFATDIHQGSLDTAARGIYPEDAVKELSDDRRERYFQKNKLGWQVSPALRDMVVFASHNVFSDAPFTQLDLVSCRNLLIYLNPQAQKKALSLFHFALKSGGYLFLGPSETPGEIDDEFTTVDGRRRIYRKRRDVRLPLDSRMPFHAGTTVPQMPRGSTRRATVTDTRPDMSLLAIYDRLLDEYMPASILVDESYRILHTFGGAQKYLEFKAGRLDVSVVEVIAPELKTTLSGALQHTIREQNEVHYTCQINGQEDGSDEPYTLHIIAKPIVDQRTHILNILVTLRREDRVMDAKASEPEATVVSVNEMDKARIASLEAELRYSRENLQATIEELETSNEELQAANEEMLASNEELNSTNEEIQSVNEELFTVNTEHQKKIHELSVATDDMDNLLNLTKVGVIFIDDDLCIRRFTPEIGKTFNLVTHDVGRPIDGFLHNFRKENIDDSIRSVIHTGSKIERTVFDERSRPFLMRMSPYNRTEGASGVVMFITDISSVLNTENDLALHRYMTEQARDGQALLDREGNFIYVNPAYATMTGYAVDELLEMKVSDVDLIHDKSLYRDVFERSAADDISMFPSRLRRKTGEIVETEITVNTIELQGTQHLFAAIRDVTRYKAARQSLANSESLVQTLVGSAAIGIFVVSDTGILTYCNPEMLRLLGYDTSANFIGVNIRSVVKADSEGASEFLDNIDQQLSVRNRQVEFVCENGDSIPVEYNAEAIQSDKANPGYVVSFEDISHRFESQNALVQATARAEMANKAKSEFLANMSHEIRTPLTAIMGHIDLMRTNLNTEEEIAGATAIKRNAIHLLDVVNDILDLSKIENNTLEIVHEKVSVPELIADLYQMMLVRVEEKNLYFDVKMDTPIPEFIETDRLRLRQVLINLTANAIKFTPSGGVTIRLRHWVDQLTISVADTGIGIQKSSLENLFQPFVRGGTQIVAEGTGLGLSICRRLMDQMEGEISVTSQPGKGSVFSVTLPAKNDHGSRMINSITLDTHEESERTDKDDSFVSLKGSILIVEDVPDIVNVIRSLMEQSGATVSVANDGEEAVKKVLENPSLYDLLLMDVQMPNKDGLTAVRELREQGYDKPIIALTAQAMIGDYQRCIEAGYTDYISKPIDLKALTSKIQLFLQPDTVNTKKLLFVEDHFASAEVMKRIAVRSGQLSEFALKGQDALEIAHYFNPDICVIDINLPDMTGHELLKAFKQIPALSNTKFVALTGQEPENGMEQYIRAGFDDALLKPVDAASLRKIWTE